MTSWTVDCQAPLSMGFSRQEYWSGLLFLSPGYLPETGIKPRTPALQADALPPEPPGKLKIVKISFTLGFDFSLKTYTHQKHKMKVFFPALKRGLFYSPSKLRIEIFEFLSFLKGLSS